MKKIYLSELVEFLSGQLVDIYVNTGITYLYVNDIDIDDVTYCELDHTYAFRISGFELNISATSCFEEDDKNVFKFETDNHLIVISK